MLSFSDEVLSTDQVGYMRICELAKPSGMNYKKEELDCLNRIVKEEIKTNDTALTTTY